MSLLRSCRHRAVLHRPAATVSVALAIVVGAACGSAAPRSSARPKADAAGTTTALPAADPKVIRVGLIPIVAPDTQKAAYQVLADHFEVWVSRSISVTRGTTAVRWRACA